MTCSSYRYSHSRLDKPLFVAEKEDEVFLALARDVHLAMEREQGDSFGSLTGIEPIAKIQS